ncbi:hypothetical protein MHYP_G00310510 [Metynnis hypsauchen]
MLLFILNNMEAESLAGDEMLEVMATESEAQVIKDLVLTDLQDRKHCDFKMMNSADTEAEAIKPKQIHGDETDTPNEQLLGCEVMSAADTEAEASTDCMNTHMESNDTPNDHCWMWKRSLMLNQTGCLIMSPLKVEQISWRRLKEPSTSLEN